MKCVPNYISLDGSLSQRRRRSFSAPTLVYLCKFRSNKASVALSGVHFFPYVLCDLCPTLYYKCLSVPKNKIKDFFELQHCNKFSNQASGYKKKINIYSLLSTQSHPQITPYATKLKSHQLTPIIFFHPTEEQGLIFKHVLDLKI